MSTRGPQRWKCIVLVMIARWWQESRLLVVVGIDNGTSTPSAVGDVGGFRPNRP